MLIWVVIVEQAKLVCEGGEETKEEKEKNVGAAVFELLVWSC